MQSIVGQLRAMFEAALVAMLGEDGRGVDPLLRPAGDPKFGDYQSNVAMGLAKQTKQKPQGVAQRLVDAIGPAGAAMVERFEIAGPGFINIHLSNRWLADALNAVPPAGEVDRLGIPPVAEPETVVVDYSSPNIAKQMHVGHLRSTIIGDTIARVLEFEGHRVIRQNHIGDWGTQFGMLIAYLKEKMPAALEGPGDVHVADLEGFYKEANALAAQDSTFAERARAEVVRLHQGDPTTLKAWQYIVGESRNHYMPIYRRLGVKLTPADERGESFYNDRLPGLVADLVKQFGPGSSSSPASPDGPRVRIEENDGALCVFHTTAAGEPMFKNPEGNPLPMIIRKSDGAFLYATTDFAAMQFRIGELHADRIVYVTDARQSQHFEMVFAAGRAMGWTRRASKPEVRLEHASFGSILGEDRRPLKTRSGENVKLSDLLDEAVNRAEQLIRASEADPVKRRGFAEPEIHDVAEAVGIGAVKYADLSQNRQSDYVFSWDRMLALEGNTAPYLMYAYARVRSIYRKGAEQAAGLADGAVILDEPASGGRASCTPCPAGETPACQSPERERGVRSQSDRIGSPGASAERALALRIARFAETIDGVAAGLRINLLTDYLYELSGAFMKFYESCPVLAADTPQQRASRLKLCDLTARTLRVGLDLLGIRTLERM